MLKTHWRSLCSFIALIVVIQAIGSMTTIPNIPVWYAGLQRPAWSPPNWLFGPVWTVLYAILAITGWYLWVRTPRPKFKQPVLIFYFLQLLCNALWSPLFFQFHLLDFAFVDLLLIILFTIITIYHAARISRPIAWFLVPYLLWLSYAASLNGAIAVMN